MFFIVFYNKVLKKSSFLAFFGQRLSVDLGAHGVMPSKMIMYNNNENYAIQTSVLIISAEGFLT